MIFFISFVCKLVTQSLFIANLEESFWLSHDANNKGFLGGEDDFGNKPENSNIQLKKIDNQFYKIANSRSETMICNRGKPQFQKADPNNQLDLWVIKFSKNEDDSYVLVNTETNGYLTWHRDGGLECDISCDFGLCEKNVTADDDFVILEDNHYWKIERN